MSRESLTDLKLRKLRGDSTQRMEIWDGSTPGFGVRVSASGIKTFVYMYRQHGRKRRVTIGRYPDIKLADARAHAHELRARVSRGEDPADEVEVGEDKTRFDVAVDDFVRLHCARHNRESTRRETERVLKQVFVTRWRRRDLATIGRSEVLRVLDDIVKEGKPSAANHALAAIRKFFNWCVERGLVDQSPCMAIRRPSKVVSRDRVLSDEELAAVWSAADATGFPFGRIVQLLILTAQRRTEVADMRWSDIDFDERVWSIPAERNKSARAHTVPLTDAAVAVLASVPRLSDEFVFPSVGAANTSFSGFSKCKQRLDAAAGIDPWRLHDLRRTVATGLARQGTLPHVVERLLNHVSGSLGGVAGVYNRFQYLGEMREALDAWSAHVSTLGDIAPNNE